MVQQALAQELLPSAGSLLASDIRSVIDALREQGELKDVTEAHWNLELGAITELLAWRDGPALLFDEVKDYPPGYRVLSNLLNSPRRMALFMGLSKDVRGVELVRTIKERIASVKLLDPVESESASFREERHSGRDINMWEFPSPFWHEHDGGRYFGTADAVVTRHPETGWVNLGTYRVQVHDERTLGLFVEPGHHAAIIFQHYWERGEACPIAICTGVQPGVLLASHLSIPWGVSEYQWAGGFIGSPVQIVRGDVTGLPLPASAEIVIEGFVPPPSEETRMEGPFGEFTGYYGSGANQSTVIRVEQVEHRRNPILVGAPPLRPPASSSCAYLFRAANVWAEIERAGVPDVRGVWMNPAGGSVFLAVISIKQRYAGHAKQAAQAAMSGRAGGANMGRFVIVVDEDIDPADTDQVLWAVATRCDPESSIDVIRDCTSGYLDPRLSPEKRAAHDYSASRAILNACRPWGWRAQFPQEVGTSPELARRVLADWPELFVTRGETPS